MSLYQWADSMLRRSYLRAVKPRIAVILPNHVEAIYTQIQPEADVLYQANAHLAIDTPAESNLKLTSLTLATYRLLLTHRIERRAALSLIQEALLEPNRKKMGTFTRFMIRVSRDPVALLGWISKSKAKSAYGQSFEFVHETDNFQTHFTTTVKKCLYHDFFRSNGAPEMTPVFCAFDDLWGDLLADGRYGVQFKRPTTIGWGGDICRFEFHRTKRNLS